MNLNPVAFEPPITSHIRSQHIANINCEQDRYHFIKKWKCEITFYYLTITLPKATWISANSHQDEVEVNICRYSACLRWLVLIINIIIILTEIQYCTQYNLFTVVGSVFKTWATVLFLLIVPTASFTSEPVTKKGNQIVLCSNFYLSNTQWHNFKKLANYFRVVFHSIISP